ncbi:uncharacterized protein LOC135208658 [Macrobrachium nipponense]|uniref:uncharacterized protein LOC135208658 n=1 Tax=Macrobrachium nipponense TaxID=159736 RepID=UPI0030C87AE9
MCEVDINKFADEDAELADARLYREIVGSLIYIMTATRLDLSYIVNKLSQYMAKPTLTHLTMAKHGTLTLASNPVRHQRSKHIDMKYHFIRSEVQNGGVKLEYVPSEQNVSGVFTKTVARIKFRAFSSA